MKRSITTEDDLKAYELNMKKIKGTVGGGGTAMPPAITLKRRSVTNPSHAPYRSKWEAAYASKLELEQRMGLIKQWWYEPFSLWLPGKVRFKPDFLIEYAMATDGRGPMLEVIEVKGWSKNRRDGITRLKIAAALFPCFVWRMVYRTNGGGWDGEYL